MDENVQWPMTLAQNFRELDQLLAGPLASRPCGRTNGKGHRGLFF